MDTRTGEIYTPKQLRDMRRLLETLHPKSTQARELSERLSHAGVMVIPPTETQLRRRPPKVGRNEPCPCGSGKKFKRCCLER